LLPPELEISQADVQIRRPAYLEQDANQPEMRLRSPWFSTEIPARAPGGPSCAFDEYGGRAVI